MDQPHSEYRHSFALDTNQQALDDFLLNLKYRRSRRLAELTHRPLWGDDDIDETAQVRPRSGASVPGVSPMIPVLPSSVSEAVHPASHVAASSRLDEGVQVDPSYWDSCAEVSQKVKDDLARPASSSASGPLVSTKLGSIPDPRVTGVTAVGPQQQHVRAERASAPLPLYPFGWADQRSLDQKRTFNVLAPPKQVVPSALRAYRRRKLSQHQQASTSNRGPLAARGETAVLDDLRLRSWQESDSDRWTTEYQASFPRKSR